MVASSDTTCRWRPMWVPVALPPPMKPLPKSFNLVEEVLEACKETYRAAWFAFEAIVEPRHTVSAKFNEMTGHTDVCLKETDISRQHFILARLAGFDEEIPEPVIDPSAGILN
jgi:hypothetical protein